MSSPKSGRPHSAREHCAHVHGLLTLRLLHGKAAWPRSSAPTQVHMHGHLLAQGNATTRNLTFSVCSYRRHWSDVAQPVGSANEYKSLRFTQNHPVPCSGTGHFTAGPATDPRTLQRASAMQRGVGGLWCELSCSENCMLPSVSAAFKPGSRKSLDWPAHVGESIRTHCVPSANVTPCVCQFYACIVRIGQHASLLQHQT